MRAGCTTCVKALARLRANEEHGAVPIDDTRRLLFVRVPKNACTCIGERLAMRALGHLKHPLIYSRRLQ